MKVFLTGGAGYIGSHILTELLAEGHEACLFDNFSNASPAAPARVRRITNRDFEVVEGDIRDGAALTDAMTQFAPDVVIHLAGLKAVGESTAKPLMYYENNVQGSVALLHAMEAAGCQRIVFSSSATVYGVPKYLPFDEAHPLAPTNPYGRSKLMIEEMIGDWCAARPDASAVLLRYFNPVGAHASGQIGEDPNDIPNNLMPFIAQVAVGRRDALQVFGTDYDTRDGSGERDYIHVVDLARAHLAALPYCMENTGCEPINVGTGGGVTVLEMVAAFQAASGRDIPWNAVGRRAGDVAISLADATKAAKLLNWTAQYDVNAMCADTWAWQSANPQGYEES
ncbi:UDP-galactose-4-epimerase [Actibacterium mucosum KCTC 23349]|uniref:UDP-glucose 4-epimerase n=1 Tax=Actibacterium mucosum KCTC 23349 TaxID=1454373 RepID=A0A037ZKY6_9RHOB|nr:UDP-glucose 4-epimerase GalE [Actibacterium mucosum]KAJ55471.1 UDP-galactose-4-epimerase [Actibacterium mucosum KCTC 23349]